MTNAEQTIKVHISTDADTKPLEKYDKTLGELKGSLNGVGNVVTGVASKFGGFGAAISGLIRNFLRGGIWGIMATAVSELWVRWRDGAKEAADRAAEAVKKSAEETKAAVAEIASAFDSGISSVDKYTSRLEKQIETTKRLAIAEKELEKQRALASGDRQGAAKADEAIAVISAKSEEEAEAARVKSYERRRALAVDAERAANKELDKATAEVEKVHARRQAMLGDPGRRGDRSVSYKPGDESSAWGRANREAVAWESLHNGWRLAYLRENRGADWEARVKDYRDRVFREERKKIFASDEWKKSGEDLATTREAAGKASQTLADMRQALADIDADEKRRLAENAAKKKESEAKAIADTSAAEVKAAQDAAKERDRLDRELHQKRMADLRAEIAAQKDAASPFQAVAATAATEFERAFAMYRDPSRAAAEIGEERDRDADLKRLHRDASRYGGKWRIDELSQLMAAGDSAGVQSRLEDWRKSRSFTPEVESMVRASAAEQTKTTAEDELRKLNDKTVELSQKLDQLAQTRDGKLDGIERNTNQLANKLDELLTVKG